MQRLIQLVMVLGLVVMMTQVVGMALQQQTEEDVQEIKTSVIQVDDDRRRTAMAWRGARRRRRVLVDDNDQQQHNENSKQIRRRQLRHKKSFSFVATFLSDAGISGTIQFDPSCLRGATQITVNLLGLNQQIGHWDIHDGSVSGGCNTVLTDYVITPKKGSVIMAGLLSSRLGEWSDDDYILDRMYLDTVVPISGKDNIYGKIMVLHDKTTGLKVACAQIVLATSTTTKKKRHPHHFG